MLDKKKISRKDATELIGLKNTKPYEILTELLDENLIVKQEQGRSTFFIPWRNSTEWDSVLEICFPLKEGYVNVSEQVKRLLKSLDDRMSIKFLMDKLNLKHRPTFLYDYLQPSMDMEFIEMTQPDSPKSPTQKYRLTAKGIEIKKQL